jgi:hypothetical protein
LLGFSGDFFSTPVFSHPVETIHMPAQLFWIPFFIVSSLLPDTQIPDGSLTSQKQKYPDENRGSWYDPSVNTACQPVISTSMMMQLT